MPAPMPERLVPMLARLSKLPADDGGWGYEVKWDGVRAIAYVAGGALRLESRNLNDVTPRYPEVARLTAALGGRDAVLDGEVVAFDENGSPSFERLQGRMHLTTGVAARARITPVVYVAFDLLWIDGESLMPLPYTERRGRLEQLGAEGPGWRVPGYSTGSGSEFLAASAAQGLEGIMCKRLDSPYEPGRRGGTWLKVKNTRRQELVIGGWQPGAGRRSGHLGALLVGHYDGGELRYAGKVGTGFDDRELARLQGLLRGLERPTSPFTGRQPERGSMWVEPQLVAEVEFNEWTRQGMLRHPSYKGLQDDKRPFDVVLEKPEAPVELPAVALDYYGRAAPVLLPYLRGRSAIDSAAALIDATRDAPLGLAVPVAPLDAPDKPAALILTVADPATAHALHGLFEQLGLQAFALAIGSGRVDVHVPLNGGAIYDEAAPIARAVAETIERAYPGSSVDASACVPGAAAPVPYSLHLDEAVNVAMPLEWDELDGKRAFDPEAALARIEARGDLFAPALTLRQQLPRFD
jgi:DNA ligase D-like protein (predicted ligase)